MPVSKAMMITSDRTTSTTRSNTGDQRLLSQHLAQRRMRIRHQGSNGLQLVRTAGYAKLLGNRAEHAPIRASVGRRRGATLLALDAALQIGDASLTLVGVGHRQKDVD